MAELVKTDRFYRVIWPHAQVVLRTARFLCHNDSDAEDIAQETMIKAYKSLDSFTEGSNIISWLLTILRNTRIDHLRKGKIEHGNVSLDNMVVEPADDALHASANDPTAWSDPDAMLEGFSDQNVIEALRTLPEDIRWTLLLVDVQGLNQLEAAEIMDVPEGTVKSRAHRGRAMLRSVLLTFATDMRLVR